MAKKAVAKKPKTLTWPNGKKVAVSLTIMFETWPDDSAPNYSVQTTHLKKGTVDHAAKAWSTYGGRVGVWRLVRTLDRLGIPATFLPFGHVRIFGLLVTFLAATLLAISVLLRPSRLEEFPSRE